MNATKTLYTRPGEVQIEVTCENAGICRTCDKPLTEARFAWDHRITDDPFNTLGPWKLGEDSFTLLRHSDGSKPCWTESEDLAKPVCPKCGGLDTLHVRQEAYGDRTTCTVAGCDYTDWYDIGD